MSAIINISSYLNGLTSSRSVNLEAAGTTPSATRSGRTAPTDTVEFSRAALRQVDAVEESTWRIARQAAIKAEIEEGTYITNERLAGTVERLLDVLA